MADTRQISLFAERVKNLDPRLYDQFIHVVAAWTDELTVAVTEADASAILVAQGRAQQARKMLQLLTEFPNARGPQPPSP